MSVFNVIWHELQQDGRENYRPRIRAIRVTKDAIPGAPAAVTITEERSRHVAKLYALQDGGVAHFHDGPLPMEVLIHPEDWGAVLTDARLRYVAGPGNPTSLFGVPVVS